MTGEYYRLYRECFPEDSVACTNAVAERLDLSERRQKLDGGLRSALYLVEKKLFYKGKSISVPHVVGLGTFEKDRKKGYADALLKETLISSDAPLITLFPFKHSFYEKYGFATVSFDFPSPAKKGKPVPHERAAEVYGELCEGLDYYFERGADDFGFYGRVFAADGESFLSTSDGIDSPDGFFPKKFYQTDIPGVMARITNLEKALLMSGVDCDVAIEVKDEIIIGNNRCFRLRGGKILPCDGAEITVDIAEMTKAIFGKSRVLGEYFHNLNGYLADKY